MGKSRFEELSQAWPFRASQPTKEEGKMKKRACLWMVILGVLCLAVVFSAMAKDEPAKTAPAPAAAAAKGNVIFLPSARIAEVEIKAPVEKVFKYTENPMNVLKWFPDVKTITDVKGKGLGQTFRWTYQRGEELAEGQDVCVDFVRNQRTVVIATYGGTWTTLYLPTPAGGTKLTMVLQSSLPVPAGDPAAWPGIVKKEQDYLQGLANNIKTEVEKK
jgi:hypothetical protein